MRKIRKYFDYNYLRHVDELIRQQFIDICKINNEKPHKLLESWMKDYVNENRTKINFESYKPDTSQWTLNPFFKTK